MGAWRGRTTLVDRPLAAVRLHRLGPLQRVFLYGLAGLCVEVAFTAVYDALTGTSDARLTGQTYLWMHPIWGFGLLAQERVGLVLRARRVVWPLRAAIYIVGAFAVEYASGWTLREILGTAPWDYSAAWASIDGLIRLDYAGGWAAVGLIAERLSALLLRVRL